jgi:hypothetical protein
MLVPKLMGPMVELPHKLAGMIPAGRDKAIMTMIKALGVALSTLVSRLLGLTRNLISL